MINTNPELQECGVPFPINAFDGNTRRYERD
jgi:hypothetical protein